MSRSANSRVSTWSQFYGIDKRQARRLRRRVAKGMSQPCSRPGCLLKAGTHRVHYLSRAYASKHTHGQQVLG